MHYSASANCNVAAHKVQTVLLAVHDPAILHPTVHNSVHLSFDNWSVDEDGTDGD